MLVPLLCWRKAPRLTGEAISAGRTTNPDNLAAVLACTTAQAPPRFGVGGDTGDHQHHPGVLTSEGGNVPAASGHAGAGLPPGPRPDSQRQGQPATRRRHGGVKRGQDDRLPAAAPQRLLSRRGKVGPDLWTPFTYADDSPTGKLMEAIIESVDEFYSENLAQEVVRGMRESASRGYFLASRAPFGYNRIKVSDGVKDRPTLEVDPVAAPIVKEIFESSHRGNGLKEICKELNGRGITNRGRRWQKNIVHYLLTNEAYTGTAVWGVKSKDEKAQEPVRVEDAWPALVSRETFDLVQQGLHERAPTVQRPARVGSPSTS